MFFDEFTLAIAKNTISCFTQVGGLVSTLAYNTSVARLRLFLYAGDPFFLVHASLRVHRNQHALSSLVAGAPKARSSRTISKQFQLLCVLQARKCPYLFQKKDGDPQRRTEYSHDLC